MLKRIHEKIWILLPPGITTIVLVSVTVFAVGSTIAYAETPAARWVDQTLAMPYASAQARTEPVLQLIRQDHEQLEANKSVIKTPMTIGQRRFERGLGTHSVSDIRVYSPEPIARFSAFVGVDHNARTQGGAGSVVFAVWTAGRELYRSEVLRGGQAAQRIDVDADGARVLDLHVTDAGDGPACDHADWADAQVTTQGGKTLFLDELRRGTIPHGFSSYPFSFICGGQSSDGVLATWPRDRRTGPIEDGKARTITTWTDAATGLRVTWDAVRFADFPAVEWVLYFENTGSADTPIIENVQALNLTLLTPLDKKTPYRLYKTAGGPASPNDFAASVVVVGPHRPETLSAGQGRSSHASFPFFKIESGRGSAIVAVGWSGMWKARFDCADGTNLHVTAGLERTHFRLHPGEKVRSPRMLLLLWEGETQESNAQFRQLIYRHYAAKRDGKTPLPTLFCNTCFTRGGGWLNECNAENQISLIKAYAPLGLELLLTDAGWFEGGWPAGAGNWNPRKDAYPEGMGPVAAAAKADGMVYGLWFEPERVVADTGIHKAHPEWCLASLKEPEGRYLLNFGLPEVQEHFFNIVKGFMDLPGFRVYRQDFNMDPLPYWRFNDAPDRQGITEMKYIEGLYAYWDRIAKTWPDSWREECASGGNRIDLETVMRMHCHQKTDYWFDNETDQASLWGLSQYLPNNVVVAHLNRMDDYSFHSTMASSLCLGWIADAPDFDAERGKRLLERYLKVRHLLVGAWYPLLPYTRDPATWMASQYHRPDLNEGMVLVFRHAESPYRTADVSLRGLDADATYDVTFDSTGQTTHSKGADLMRSFSLTIPEKHGSDLVAYKKRP